MENLPKTYKPDGSVVKSRNNNDVYFIGNGKGGNYDGPTEDLESMLNIEPYPVNNEEVFIIYEKGDKIQKFLYQWDNLGKVWNLIPQDTKIMKEKFYQIIGKKKEIHEIAKSHGFWDDKDKQDLIEKKILIISELGEALEADRKNSHPSNWYFENYLESFQNSTTWSYNFQNYVKDTFEDEIADATIRALDLGHFMHIPFEYSENYNFIKEGKVSNLLFDLVKTLTIYPTEYSINYFLNQIVFYSYSIFKIDLLKHIKLKMKYNSLREHLHGKAY